MPANKTQKMTEPNNKLRKFQRSSNKFHVLRITRRGITMLDELHEAQCRSPKFHPSHILHARRYYNTNISTCMSFMWKWIHKEKASTLYCSVYSKSYWRKLNLTCKEVPWQCTLPRVEIKFTGLPARNNVKMRLSLCLRTTHWKLIDSEGKYPVILNYWRGHHFIASTPRTIRMRYPFQMGSKEYQ